MRPLIAVFLLALAPGCVSALDSSAGRIEVTAMATGLEEPWAIAFLPAAVAVSLKN